MGDWARGYGIEKSNNQNFKAFAIIYTFLKSVVAKHSLTLTSVVASFYKIMHINIHIRETYKKYPIYTNL